MVSSQHAPPEDFVNLGTDSEANEAVYDSWANRYEEDIRNWGYTLPEKAATLLHDHLRGSTERDLAILDAGAGDGLSGVALREAGFGKSHCRIVGSDISRAMLERAENRENCPYDATMVIDLNRSMKGLVEDESFDAVHCIGTLTYVRPDSGVLREFVRVTKPGGFVCYSNRTDKAGLWTEEEAELPWTLVAKEGPMPYLPGNPDYADKVQVYLYLYRVLEEKVQTTHLP